MSEKANFGHHSTKVKQLSDMISQDIALGKYKTDTGLPSINYLSKTYNVSRDTVFKAFLDLREKRLENGIPRNIIGLAEVVYRRQTRVCLVFTQREIL